MALQKSQKPIPYHIPDFLDWLDIQKGLANKSQESYARFINKFLVWLKENGRTRLKPHQLSPDHIWQYKVFLSRQSKKPLKRSTQNYYLIALRSLLMFFASRNILSLPADKVELARYKKERAIKFLTLDQLKKLFAAPDTSTITGLRDRAILETLFSTGMRIAELVSLNQEQIKIEPATTWLELTIVGKGGRPRVVYVSKRALGWLSKYLKVRSGDKANALFINYRAKAGADRRLTARYVEKAIKRYALKAGVPIFTTPHVLRHSFSTDLLAKGVDLRTIQEFLGHRTIAATEIYTHITSKRLSDIHRKFHSGGRL